MDRSMSNLGLLLIASLIAGACEAERGEPEHAAADRDILHHVGDIGEEAEDGRDAAALALAQQDFANLRALRVASLRAEHSAHAIQPLLIRAIANGQPLRRASRARLDQNLEIFRQRLAHTRDAIEELQYVSAADWERRDDEVGQAMADMFEARDASWQVLGETSPET
jgi:hypothetical protein